MKNELGFIDIISIISFCIALENLEMNIDQEDMQELQHKLDSRLSKQIKDIHDHLDAQDKKIDNILSILKENGGIIYVGK